ncbi:hypothetical protein MGN70_013904 [Eutypa lata]|nr:hypothetical protein MGN70_013904 [Eutypa lata]
MSLPIHLISLLILYSNLSYCSLLPKVRDGTGSSSMIVSLSTTSVSVGNSSIIPLQSTELVKGITTAIAGLAAILTAVTYVTVLKLASPLSHGVALPTEFIEDVINPLLSKYWPKRGLELLLEDSVLAPEERMDPQDKFRILRFNTRDINAQNIGPRQVLGYTELWPGDREYVHNITPMDQRKTWIIAASPAMKSLVQMAIWEFVSFWLSTAMVINTAVYNGFASGRPGRDGTLRLSLVSAYALANLTHILLAKRLFTRSFTAIACQACWSIISRHFAFTEKETEVRNTLRTIESVLLGETYLSTCFELTDEMEYSDTPDHFHALEPVDSVVNKVIAPVQEKEIEVLEKAAESGLDRVLANIVIMLGICLANGLAPWTSVQSSESTTAQIGSYALLLTLGTGGLALLSSITHLSNATDSARRSLQLQNYMIFLPYRRHFSKFQRPLPSSYKSADAIIGAKWLKFWDLWNATKGLFKIGFIFLGPALGLLPRHEEVLTPGRLRSKIGNVTVQYNLSGLLLYTVAPTQQLQSRC